MGLTTPKMIWELQRKLCLKAKREPTFCWLVHKHRIGSRGECRYPVGYIYNTLGVVCPTGVLENSRKP